MFLIRTYPCRYQYLSVKIRKELPSRLLNLQEEFHLENLYYDSFTRRYGMLNYWIIELLNYWIIELLKRWGLSPLWSHQLSFPHSIDIRTEFSAADVVNAVSALLEQCSSDSLLVNDHVITVDNEVSCSWRKTGIELTMPCWQTRTLLFWRRESPIVNVNNKHYYE